MGQGDPGLREEGQDGDVFLLTIRGGGRVVCLVVGYYSGGVVVVWDGGHADLFFFLFFFWFALLGRCSGGVSFLAGEVG